MAKVRIGFSTAFELENELVGIGTDNPNNTLQALGNIQSSDAKAIGVTTLTAYQGFVDTKLSLQGSVGAKQGTTSGEIIVEGTINVSSGTTFTSGPENLTVTDSFTLPGISDDVPSAGTTRFNEDTASLEFYNGSEWKAVNSYVDMGNRGRALVAGGENGPSGTDYSFIEYTETSTLGNTQDFGDLTSTSMQNPMGLSNSIRALFGGGSSVNIINYVTVASTGNGIDFGDLTSARPRGSALSSSTRGIFVGGNPGVNILDYVEIMTLGDAIDFGDMSFDGQGPSSTASPTRGIITNGFDSEANIDSITIASKGNGADFGKDLFYGGYGCTGGASTGTRGVWMGGYTTNTSQSPQLKRRTTLIRGVEFASGGQAVGYGDMLSRSDAVYCSAAGTTIRGLCFGGFDPDISNDLSTNTIQYMNIRSGGDAIDFGDMALPRYSIGSACDSHGGLGGY